MATKKKRGYPPTMAQVNRWEKIEREHHRLSRIIALRPFVDLFEKTLGTLAASTPYDAWPEQFKIAFKHATRHFGYDIANEYKRELPDS